MSVSDTTLQELISKLLAENASTEEEQIKTNEEGNTNEQ